jgi:hypothetical protein
MTLASIPKAYVRRAVRPLVQTWKRVRLSGCYTDLHNNLDPNVHLREAIEWMKRAQDFGTDRGVSYGARFRQGFLPSYPETTGYIICTFVELSKIHRIAEYLERAIEMGLWEVAVQMASGAVMGGQVNKNPTPAVFNTGQVLLGWASLYEETGDERFARAGERAAAWLMSMQESDGHWIRGNSDYAEKGATLYNVKAAWGLARMGRAIGNEEIVRAAVRNAEYTIAQQASNGWFPDCCLSDPQRPLLHTIAYTMQGLMGIGMLTGRQDFVNSASRTADKLLKLMDPGGFLPGRFNSSMAGTVEWCCLTGTAQTSIVWSQLYELAGREEYREAVHRANLYLMARHDIAGPDPAIRGGVAGSWPVWGDYCPFMVINWATKFFIDALLAEQRINAHTRAGGNNA